MDCCTTTEPIGILPGKPELRSIFEASKNWCVDLKNSTMEYFEIQPNSSCEKHTHDRDMITMIMDGELFYRFNDGIQSVGKGESIMIPASVQHAVFTKDKNVKAINAVHSPKHENQIETNFFVRLP
ncbi:MAG: cupin domain-containing protein [bacterium]|nr:cupin domain-containing protein [bacterium]